MKNQKSKLVASKRELDAALIVFACIISGALITLVAIAVELTK